MDARRDERGRSEEPFGSPPKLERLEEPGRHRYSCPYCDRNDLKGQRGMTLHCQSQHPKKAVPEVNRQNVGFQDLSEREQLAVVGILGGVAALYVLYQGVQSFLTWVGQNPLLGGFSIVAAVAALSVAGYYTQQYRMQKEQERKKEQAKLHNRVISAIRNFEPSQDWKNEEGYQAELQGQLKSEFGSQVEVTKGASRTDLEIEDIAIEIKGPTSHQDLESVASKAMKYSQHWSHVVVSLFDVEVSDDYYQEWLEGMEKQYPDVEVIRIDST